MGRDGDSHDMGTFKALALPEDMLGMIVGFELEPHVPAVTESRQAIKKSMETWNQTPFR